jgi:hypothetical protein
VAHGCPAQSAKSGYETGKPEPTLLTSVSARWAWVLWLADGSFRSSMSVAVIGGLITSTVLSLLVVPAVFTYIDDLEHWFKRMGAKLRGKPAPVPAQLPPAPQSKALS